MGNHECPNCGFKVPDWEWNEEAEMCDECLADTEYAGAML